MEGGRSNQHSAVSIQPLDGIARNAKIAKIDDWSTIEDRYRTNKWLIYLATRVRG
jgi:hypothetical protein